MESPDHDARDASRSALERHEVADAALVEPAIVVDDEDPTDGVTPGSLQRLEEHVDRSDVANWQRATGDRSPFEQRPKPAWPEPDLEPMTDDGVGNRCRRELRSVHRNKSIVVDAVRVHQLGFQAKWRIVP